MAEITESEENKNLETPVTEETNQERSSEDVIVEGMKQSTEIENFQETTEVETIPTENIDSEVSENAEPALAFVDNNDSEMESEFQISDADLDEVIIESEVHFEEPAPETVELHEAEHEAEELVFDDLSFDELKAKFEDLLSKSIFLQSRNIFKKFRDRVREIIEENRKAAREKHQENGGLAEDFEYQHSPEEKEMLSKLDELNKGFAEQKRKKEQELQDNYLKKIDILDELKNLIANEQDITKAREVFNQLQEKFNSIGHVPPLAANDIYQRYRLYSDNFYKSLQLHRDLFKVELQKNLEMKLRIVKGVENLMKIPSIKKSSEYLQDYHKQWRETGPVPRIKNEELWKRFKDATDAVYKRRDEYVEKLNEQKRNNLSLKEAFIAEMEALASAVYNAPKDFKDAEKAIQELDKKWRTVGRVPQEINEEVWQRFREARKTFVRKKNEVYASIDAEFQKNLEVKNKLIAEAESLLESTDWKKTSARFIQLQNDWKNSGPAPRKVSDEVWKRFRAAADTFFKNKEEFFAGSIEREKQNLEAKRKLIEELKNHQHSEDLKESSAYISEIKKKWAEIGFVPFKEKQGIEKEFDDLVKSFFDKIKISEGEGSKTDYKGKLDAIAASGDSAYEQLKSERQFLRNRAEKLREEITQLDTNLQFFGNSKNADALKKPYADKLERAKKDLENVESKQFALKHVIKAFEGK